jgi:hypothetical protein
MSSKPSTDSDSAWLALDFTERMAVIRLLRALDKLEIVDLDWVLYLLIEIEREEWNK